MRKWGESARQRWSRGLALVLPQPGWSMLSDPSQETLHFRISLIFFFKQRDRQRQTNRQSRSAHGACVGEAAGRLTAAILRECRGLQVVWLLTCSANSCRFWMELFRNNKKASVKRLVAMSHPLWPPLRGPPPTSIPDLFTFFLLAWPSLAHPSQELLLTRPQAFSWAAAALRFVSAQRPLPK